MVYQEQANCLAGQAARIGTIVREASKCEPDPKAEKQIPHQLKQLDNAICDIEQYFSDLQNRIAPVTRKEVSGGTQEESKDPSLSCDLADHLRLQVKRLQNIGKEIVYMIKTVEL